MFLQLESHCEGRAGKSASAHILGMMALQKLSRVEHNDVSNALCLKGSQKVARGRREIVKCQFQKAEPHSHRQTKDHH